MKRATRGFTLVETLVALAVLSLGLLGAAAMLLDSLRAHGGALRRIVATSLVRDMADRIRANPLGGTHYVAADAAVPACDSSAGCLIAQRAAADREHFTAAARALFPAVGTDARVEFVPAIGPASPAHYFITLRWPDSRSDAGTDSVALQVSTQWPVAG